MQLHLDMFAACGRRAGERGVRLCDLIAGGARQYAKKGWEAVGDDFDSVPIHPHVDVEIAQGHIRCDLSSGADFA